MWGERLLRTDQKKEVSRTAADVPGELIEVSERRFAQKRVDEGEGLLGKPDTMASRRPAVVGEGKRRDTSRGHMC